MRVKHIVTVSGYEPDTKSKSNGRWYKAGSIECINRKQAEALAEMLAGFGSNGENVFDTQFTATPVMKVNTMTGNIIIRDKYELESLLSDLSDVHNSI